MKRLIVFNMMSLDGFLVFRSGNVRLNHRPAEVNRLRQTPATRSAGESSRRNPTFSEVARWTGRIVGDVAAAVPLLDGPMNLVQPAPFGPTDAEKMLRAANVRRSNYGLRARLGVMPLDVQVRQQADGQDRLLAGDSDRTRCFEMKNP
jgi:hypothetical protein